MKIAKKVESSNIDRVDYDGQDLFVTFKSGAVYRYEGIKAGLVLEFVNAESAGSFLNTRIKPEYRGVRIK